VIVTLSSGDGDRAGRGRGDVGTGGTRRPLSQDVGKSGREKYLSEMQSQLAPTNLLLLVVGAVAASGAINLATNRLGIVLNVLT